MASRYVILSIVLAVTLNASNRWARAAGTLLAAAALFMLSISIVLANFDGTYAGFHARDLWRRTTPIVLDLLGILGLAATLFLLWAAWTQIARRSVAPVAMRNDTSRFGLVSRYAHWITATLMLLLIPLGLFVTVLPTGDDRASFLAAHQALGLTVLIVVAVRLAWLAISPPPPQDQPRLQHGLAIAAHVALYALIIAFPISGYLMAASGNEQVDFYGWTLPGLAPRGAPIWRTLHDVVLPLAFYGVIFLHIGAVLKHHFADRRPDDIRRMLR